MSCLAVFEHFFFYFLELKKGALVFAPHLFALVLDFIVCHLEFIFELSQVDDAVVQARNNGFVITLMEIELLQHIINIRQVRLNYANFLTDIFATSFFLFVVRN